MFPMILFFLNITHNPLYLSPAAQQFSLSPCLCLIFRAAAPPHQRPMAATWSPSGSLLPIEPLNETSCSVHSLPDCSRNLCQTSRLSALGGLPGLDFLLDSEPLLLVCGPKRCCLSSPTTSFARAPLDSHLPVVFTCSGFAESDHHSNLLVSESLIMRTFQRLLLLLPCWLMIFWTSSSHCLPAPS